MTALDILQQRQRPGCVSTYSGTVAVAADDDNESDNNKSALATLKSYRQG